VVTDDMVTDDMKREWWRWHLDNLDVYELFEHYAFKAIRSGKTKCSAWLIVNRIRWDEEVETSGEFKIKNEYIAYYSRYFMYLHPEHRGFFDIKRLTNERIETYEYLSGRRNEEDCASQAGERDGDGAACKQYPASSPRRIGDSRVPGSATEAAAS